MEQGFGVERLVVLLSPPPWREVMIIALSHHQKPKTGGHKRFDRLVSYVDQSNQTLLWITPPRLDGLSAIESDIIRLSPPKAAGSVSAWLFFEVLRNRKKLRALRGRVRLVFTFGETTIPAAVLVSRLVGAPLSIGVRSNVPRRARIKRSTFPAYKRLLSWTRSTINHFLLSIAYRYASHITVQTSHAQHEFCRNYNVSQIKVDVIENDLPPDLKSRKQQRKNYDRPYSLLFIGNDSAVKGFDTLCKALARIDANMTSMRAATLVGVTQAPDYLLDNSVVSVSVLSWADNIPDLMDSHDLLLAPSREDQFPNVVLEALSLGLPVIGSAVDGIKHMLQDPFVLFHPGDIDSLENAIIRVSSAEGYARAKEIAEQRRAYFDFYWEQKYLYLLTPDTPSPQK